MQTINSVFHDDNNEKKVILPTMKSIILRIMCIIKFEIIEITILVLITSRIRNLRKSSFTFSISFWVSLGDHMTGPKNAFRGDSLKEIISEQVFISMKKFIIELPVKIDF